MNKPNKINILSIYIDRLTITEANKSIAKLLNSSKNTTTKIVVKPYVEFLVAAQKDNEIANMLNQADLCLADGVSLQWAASYLYGNPKNKRLFKTSRSGLFWLQNQQWRNQILPEKMAGANQTIGLLDMAKDNKWKVGIIGGLNSPEKIKDSVIKRFPGLNLHTWSGYYDISDEKQVVNKIANAKLDLLFVAMGFPRQEHFMFRNINNHLAKVMVGEGGTFDYEQMGGPIKRAPLWMQRTGLEWSWRLVRQPKRLHRQLGIPRFIWAVKKQAKNNK